MRGGHNCEGWMLWEVCVPFKKQYAGHQQRNASSRQRHALAAKHSHGAETADIALTTCCAELVGM
jgi:hypothetical protein